MSDSKPDGNRRPSRATRLPVIVCVVLIAAWGVYGLIEWWRARERRILIEEVLRPLQMPHHNEEGYWVGDIAENYRLGTISRKLAEADTAPLNPLVPKPIPIHGYYVRVMNSGPSGSFEGLKRCRESYAILIYPAERGVGKRTYMYMTDAYVRVRDDDWVPTYGFPTGQELKDHWAIVD
jgi:hypothetical protein